MDYTNKDSIKPVLASIGMLGVATITSVAGGPFAVGAFGLAGKVAYDLISNLAPNIASDQILKISPKKLRQYFTSGVPNLSNHDLYKGFKSSIKLGLDATIDNYKNSLSKEEYNRDHIRAIFKKVKSLKLSIDEDFDEVFINNISDEQINDYTENRNTHLYERINSFLNIEELSSHGHKFLPFVRSVLPSQILAAFTEILKNESRVWIAYQRLILTDIQVTGKETNIISHELLDKVNTLNVQLEMIQRKMNLDKDNALPNSNDIEQLWTLCEEAKDYLSLSINKLDEYYTEITSKLDDIHTDLRKEISKAGKERKDIISKTEKTIEIGEETVLLSRKHYDEFQAFKEDASRKHDEALEHHSREIAELKKLIFENMKKEVLQHGQDKKPELIQETIQRAEESAQKIAEIDYNNASGIVKQALDVLKEHNGVERALLILDNDLIESLGKSAINDDELKKVVEVYELRIELLMSKFNLNEITKCYKEIISIYNRTNPKSQLLASTLLKASANSMLNGKYSETLELQKMAIEIAEEIFGIDHPSLAHPYNNIAGTLRMLGKYSEALEFQKRDIRILKKNLDKNDPVLANSYNNISLIYGGMGLYSEALEFNKKDIAIKEVILGSKHPSLATSYNNIAMTHLRLGNYSEALEFNKKSIEIEEEVIDIKNPSLATSYNNIGMTYTYLGNYLEALKFQNKCIYIWEELLDSNHPSLGIVYWNIATTYYNLDEVNNALSYINKAKSIIKKAYPLEHSFQKDVQFWYDKILAKKENG